MAKLNKVENTDTNTTTEAAMPNLNQIALVLGIPAVRLQSAQVAYKPIEGQPYSSKQINWESVSAFIGRRLDKTDYESVEEVYAAARATEYIPKRGAGRRAGEGSVYGKVLFGTTPVRKGDVKVGDSIYRKKDNAELKVIFVDETIVVYQAMHDDDIKVVSEAIGNRMFNTNFSLEAPAAATAE